MKAFKAKNGAKIVQDMIKVIQANKDYLSEIDGLIGDGDHGINMSKGFSLCEKQLEGKEDITLSQALKTLGRILLLEIGGSMGPLYGTFFIEMSKQCDVESIDLTVFSNMINAAEQGLTSIGNAKQGDKTLMDTLIPARISLKTSVESGEDFVIALNRFKKAADDGRNATLDMVARIGRASRLGERSRGVPDAGATSCNLILQSMADSMIALL